MFIDRKIDLIRFVKEYLGIELKMHQIIMLRLLDVYYSIRGMRKTSYGYYWKYEQDFKLNENTSKGIEDNENNPIC